MVYIALLPKIPHRHLDFPDQKVLFRPSHGSQKTPELRANLSFILLEIVYSSARGGARKRIKPARAPIPRTGKKYPPKSPTLEAIICEEATWLENSVIVFSIMFN